ncbi:MAG TPA: DNA alkylation repair protein [Dehalococcoidia bacterium]|nr:DNA alkylation repair protein [Dehalococcoidia bacterium]
MTPGDVLDRLRALADPEAREGMARFGIETRQALGISIPTLRALGREVGRDHDLAGELWTSGVHEARVLAALVDDPRLVTEEQMERWVVQIDSWDVCDGVCSTLFDRTPFAYVKAAEWSARGEEFVKRAGFVLMAALAVHDKKAPDQRFLEMLPLIEREAYDDRNFVRKAVNWALRGIGKRNRNLNRAAIEAGERIRAQGSRAARWIAADALRELRSEKVRTRLK